MTSETLVKCMHKPCQCLVEEEQKFCSAACETAVGNDIVPCPCGHAGCIGEQWITDEAPGDQPSTE